MSEVFDFGTTGVPATTEWLRPGLYKASVASAKYVIPSSNSTYLEVEFVAKEGKVSAKYFISAKAIERLQYLHIELAGKPCDKKFESAEAVGAYYEKMMQHIASIKKSFWLIVGASRQKSNKTGELVDFANIPFSNYILTDDKVKTLGLSEGAFDPASNEYKLFLHVPKQAVTTDSVKIDSHAPADDDLPF
jgi:hypothetical protein